MISEFKCFLFTTVFECDIKLAYDEFSKVSCMCVCVTYLRLSCELDEERSDCGSDATLPELLRHD